MTERRTHDRSTIADLLIAMTSWPHRERVAAGLHPGDLGWHLRLPDDAIAGQIMGWWDGGDLLAVGLLEGALGRFAIRPGRELDPDLGEDVAAACREDLAGDQAYADLRPETASRRILACEGWALDPVPTCASASLRRVPGASGHRVLRSSTRARATSPDCAARPSARTRAPIAAGHDGRAGLATSRTAETPPGAPANASARPPSSNRWPPITTTAVVAGACVASRPS